MESLHYETKSFPSTPPLSNTTIDWGAKAPKILNLQTMKGNGMVF